MKNNMHQKEKRIPTIFALLIIFIGIGFTVFLDRLEQSNITSAKAYSVAEDIRFSNISDSAFNISWFTSSPSIGTVEILNDKGKMTYIDDLDNDNIPRPRTNHYITVKNLAENTVYTVKILPPSGRCDKNEKICPVLTQKTGNKLPNFSSLSPVRGSLISASNQGVSGAIVYITVSKSALLSSRTDSSGLWVIPLTNLRSLDLLSRIDISDNDIVQITAIIESGQMSTAVVDIRSVRGGMAIPPLQIGNNHNFINLLTQTGLTADSGNQKILGTQIDNANKIKDISKTNLKYDIQFPLYDNDTTTDNQPRFRGTGIKNAPILITINSTPITGRIVVESDGTWSFRPPVSLPPGNHTVSIQAYDEKGGLITIIRKFIVLKSGERVLGEATNSATLTPYVPSPTNIPAPSITISPTLNPYPSVTSTPVQTIIPTNIFPSPTLRPPATGSTETTLALIAGGGILMLAGIFLLLPL